MGFLGSWEAGGGHTVPRHWRPRMRTWPVAPEAGSRIRRVRKAMNSSYWGRHLFVASFTWAKIQTPCVTELGAESDALVLRQGPPTLARREA